MTASIPSPTRVVIDLSALAENYRCLRALIPSASEIVAVVKADAYGHGLADSVRVFLDEGCRVFAVASTDECVRLRRTVGDAARILKMTPSLPDEYETLADLSIEQVIASPEDAAAWKDWLRRQNRSLKAHLKVDRGMGRLGFGYTELAAALPGLADSPEFEWVGVMSHLPASEEPPLDSFDDLDPLRAYHTVGEIERFRRLCGEIESLLGRRVARHVANSGAVLFHPDSHFDWVRPGLALYGADPRGMDVDHLGLRPALSLESRLVQVRTIPPGGTIGYGRSHRVLSPTRVGVLPIGYADGLFRKIADRGSVLVEGRLCPILGRVSMNLISIDLSSAPNARVGDVAVLIGESCGTRIRVEQVAAWADTIPYEILTSVGRLAVQRTVLPADARVIPLAPPEVAP